MCDCIKDLEQKILAHATEKCLFRKPVKKVTMKGKAMVFSDGLNTLKSESSTDFDVELEGQKKKVPMPVIHRFCPFCGESKTGVINEKAVG